MSVFRIKMQASVLGKKTKCFLLLNTKSLSNHDFCSNFERGRCGISGCPCAAFIGNHSNLEEKCVYQTCGHECGAHEPKFSGSFRLFLSCPFCFFRVFSFLYSRHFRVVVPCVVDFFRAVITTYSLLCSLFCLCVLFRWWWCGTRFVDSAFPLLPATVLFQQVSRWL